MIKHAMDVIKLSVNHLNPGQVPVIALDQPRYAVAKEIQWKMRDNYGEDKFVMVFGGLHVEQAFLKVNAQWLENSGWTADLVDANVATPGTAESFIKVSTITRTWRAHQVTASTLFILLQRAYKRYANGMTDDVLTFDERCTSKMSTVPQFQFWHTSLQLELLLLVFLKSLRRADFGMYVDAVWKMLPWFFALNHPNYARWLITHVRDMRALGDQAPSVAQTFNQGLFAVSKTLRRFSAIAIDQAHEQNNAMVKGDGGAVGLTENPNALHRWMLSGPEMARLVNEFEACVAPEACHNASYHHEAQKSFQVAFRQDVKSLVQVYEYFGNPFDKESADLVVLDSKVVADKEGVLRMQQVEELGRKQCEKFIQERLVERETPLDEPITRNKLDFFSTTSRKKKSKVNQKLSSMKSDCSLFSRLFIACQTQTKAVHPRYLMKEICAYRDTNPSSQIVSRPSPPHKLSPPPSSQLRRDNHGWSSSGQHH